MVVPAELETEPVDELDEDEKALPLNDELVELVELLLLELEETELVELLLGT